MTRLRMRPSGQRSKFNAEKVEFYGHTFHSKAEGLRYLVLRDLEEQGVITDLALQPEYILDPPFVAADGEKFGPMRYTLDFRYRYLVAMHIWHVEEVKGKPTVDYRMRRRLFKRMYPMYVFHEVKSSHYT